MVIPDVERFWFRLSEDFPLTAEGFLHDPGGDLGSFYAAQARSLQKLRELKTLVLIGEPGIGKSTALQRLHIIAEDYVLLIDLRKYSTESALIDKLNNDPKIRSWIAGTVHLELFFDSFDECPIPLKATVIPRILEDLIQKGSGFNLEVNTGSKVSAKFKREHYLEEEDFSDRAVTETSLKERISVRLICRSGNYTPAIGKELLSVVGIQDEQLNVFKLAPLCLKDIEELASANAESSVDFLKALRGSGVTALGSIPLTLKFIFKLYINQKDIPQTAQEIYDAGIIELCGEHNELRDMPNTQRRITIAKDLALLSVTSNKHLITFESEFECGTESELWYGVGCTSDQNASGYSLSDVRDALSSSLFVRAGENCVTWVHWSFAEYLAAVMLCESNLSLAQYLDILVDYPTQSIYPNLFETAAWLASKSERFLGWLASNNPQCLLETDVSSFSFERKETVVDSILTAMEQQIIRDDYRDSYKSLYHPNLIHQLKPWIFDRSKGIMTRRVAIDIAERCEIVGLQNDLLQLALDPSEEHYTRVQAAYFVYKVGDAKSKSGLVALAIGDLGDDKDDDLKGIGLRACWPDLITIQELLPLITVPKKSNYVGSYALFLQSEFEKGLKDSDITKGLLWLAQNDQLPRGRRQGASIQAIFVRRALELLDKTGIIAGLASLLLGGAQHSITPFELARSLDIRSEKWSEANRRLLLENIWKKYQLGERKIDAFLIRAVSHSDDFVWLMRKATQALNEEEEKFWVDVASCMYDMPTELHREAFWNCVNKSSYARKAFSFLIDPVELNSEAEKNLRTYSKEVRHKKRAGDRRKGRLAKKSFFRWLRIARKEPAAFWRMQHVMIYDEFGQGEGSLYTEPNIEKLPAWKYVSDSLLLEWPSLCKRFLESTNPKRWGWKKGTIVHPEITGYRAIRFLLQTDQSYILSQEDVFFERWAPCVVMMMDQIWRDEEDIDKEVSRLFFSRSPKLMSLICELVVRREARQFEHPILIRKLKEIWCDEIDFSLSRALRSGKLGLAYEANLILEMLEIGSQRAEEYALEAISSYREFSDMDRRLNIVACLLNSSIAGVWDRIREIMHEDSAIARQILGRAFGSSSRERSAARICDRMGTQATAELYEVICDAFPYNEDIDWQGGVIDSNQALRMFRDELIRHLSALGTAEAHAAIELIADSNPPTNMSWYLIESKRNLVRNSWLPIEPVEALSICRSGEGRLVNTPEQLASVVLESLKKVDDDLRSQGRLLWNVPSRGETKFKLHPKDEEELSDYVREKIHEIVGRRGIVLNREVQIVKGQKTDILIQAVTGEDIVTVVGEVKCSWNPGLRTDIKVQLKDHYLDSPLRHVGVYIVGWYDCTNWSEGSKFEKNVKRIDVEPYLISEAKRLSEGDKTISYFGLDCSIN